MNCLKKEISLAIAERADFIQIAKDVHELWSAGLTKDCYRHFLGSTYYQPWAKRNHYRLVAKDKERVTVSCKVVHLPLAWQGKHYKILGLGAIFTSPAYRGQGLASNLIKSVIETAKQKNIDGLLLFSDIDRHFYSKLGFVSLGNLDFEIDNSFYSITNNENVFSEEIDVANNHVEDRDSQILSPLDSRISGSNSSEPKFRFSSFSPWLEDDEINEILNCYNRWLSRQPYGVVRNHNYFTFQLARHLFVATYSKNNKPKLGLTLLKNKQRIAGYAISEQGQNCLRILEIIGVDAARAELWHNLIWQAKQMGLKGNTGFESVSRDFIPYQRLEQEKLGLRPSIKPSHISCYERSWGQPMFLALNNVLNKLPNYNPCPLLEFDYL